MKEHNAEFGIRKIVSSDLLRAKETAEDNVLVVTHGGVINIIYHLINGPEWSNAKKPVRVVNCSVHVLDVDRMEISEEKIEF